ncbi:MAG: SDR family oxidoreductase [Chitinophagaceae bacterium]|nr:SDR family oxidoreductase [Chitinophagaceae bacterium]
MEQQSKRGSGRYALITGGTSGIGYELAKLFAQDGYNLIIVARTESDLANVAGELNEAYGVNVVPMATDLFNPDNAFSLYREVIQSGFEIDVLVNNAGQGHYGQFVDTDLQQEIAIIQLNIVSLVILTKQFLKDMVVRGSGRILNLSSIASKVPGPWQAVYHGTKAFVQSFTEAIRNEVKDTGVSITALLPGATDTDFFNKAGMLNSKVVQENKLDDPAKVAKDGYDALMSGDDMVVSGIKNKVQVAMSNVMSDEFVAERMNQQQKPSNGDKE